MADVLIFTDNAAYASKKAEYTNAIVIVQSVVNAYNAIAGISNLITSEMNRAFTDHAALIFDKLTAGQPVVIGGLTLNKSKAMSIMEQPVGYLAFVEALNVAKSQLNAMRITADNPQAFFQINVSDVVEISSVLDAQILAVNKFYTRCTRAEKEKAFIDAVLSAYAVNNLDDYYLGSGKDVDLGQIVNRLVIQGKGLSNMHINHKLLNWYTTATTPGQALNVSNSLVQQWD